MIIASAVLPCRRVQACMNRWKEARLPSPNAALPPYLPAPSQSYKLRQIVSTHVKPESGRLMLVLHVRPLRGLARSQPCRAPSLQMRSLA